MQSPRWYSKTGLADFRRREWRPSPVNRTSTHDRRSLTADFNNLVKAFAGAEVRTLGNSLEWMGFRISGSPIE